LRVPYNIIESISQENLMRFNYLISLLTIFLLFFVVNLSGAQDNSNNFFQDEYILTLGAIDSSVQLQGLLAKYSYWVPLPRNWSITKDIVFQLIYEASEALNPDISTLTISANGEELRSFTPLPDGRLHTEVITIPYDVISPEDDGFSINFAGYLRVTSNECEVTGIPSQWIRISPDSSLKIPAPSELRKPTLNDFSNELLPENILPGIPESSVLFVIPSYEDAIALNVASQVAFRLGQQIGNIPNMEIRSVDTVTEEDLASTNIVLIGLLETNPYILTALNNLGSTAVGNGQLLSLDSQVVPPSDGVLHIVRSPWSPVYNVLVITGNSMEGLQKAGNGINNINTVSELTGPSQFISNIDTEEITSEEPIYWRSEITTLKDFGVTLNPMLGFGKSENTLRLPYPEGELLGDNTQLTVTFQHSPLDQGSHVAIYIEDSFVGVVDTGPNGLGEYTFNLPMDDINEAYLANPSDLLDIRMESAHLLELRFCRIIDPATIWTELSERSYFTASYTPFQLPDTRLIPYPIINQYNPIPLTVVLPLEATDQDIKFALQIVAYFGKAAITDIPVSIVQGTIEAIPANSHVILLGDIPRQPLITDDLILNTAQTVYETLSTDNIGIVQEIISPWGSDFVVLFVTGTTEEGYALAVDALTQRSSTKTRIDIRVIQDDMAAFILKLIDPSELIVNQGM